MPSSADQSAASSSAAAPAAEPAKPAESEAASSAQAGATQTAENKGGNLPQTASPLPLLGLLGLGSLVTGLLGRKK
jgi:hypothetical protein